MGASSEQAFHVESEIPRDEITFPRDIANTICPSAPKCFTRQQAFAYLECPVVGVGIMHALEAPVRRVSLLADRQ